MEFLGKHSLVVHPHTPPDLVKQVTADVRLTPNKQFIAIRYEIQPAGSVTLPELEAERIDALWESTCFELFVQPAGGNAYREFNFAPLFAWNAYSFEDWRSGMALLDLSQAPHLVDSRIDDRENDFPDRYGLDVILSAEAWFVGPAKFSLAAVIEEEGGHKSYWALAHPSGPPDFHNRDCFVAHLPPVKRP